MHKYYKIQFPPYDDSDDYLYYNTGKQEFKRSWSKTANIFRDDQLEEKKLSDYLKGKEYHLVLCSKVNSMFFYRE